MLFSPRDARLPPISPFTPSHLSLHSLHVHLLGRFEYFGRKFGAAATEAYRAWRAKRAADAAAVAAATPPAAGFAAAAAAAAAAAGPAGAGPAGAGASGAVPGSLAANDLHHQQQQQHRRPLIDPNSRLAVTSRLVLGFFASVFPAWQPEPVQPQPQHPPQVRAQV